MRPLALAALAVLSSALATATTVVQPTFQQLVSHAETVFEGVVLDVQSALTADAGGRRISTSVTFQVVKVLKGDPSPVTVLTFLGGSVGNETLNVDGVPKFVVGDRDVLFVNAHAQLVSPLVALMHGRFRIVKEPRTSRDVVYRFNSTTFSSTSRLGAVEAERAAPDQAMALADFESQVVAEVERQKNERPR